MSATVEITEEDGRFRAVDSETGTTGRGETRAQALAALAVRLEVSENGSADEGPQTALRRLRSRVAERFDEGDVSEDDVEGAIAWARSQ